MGVGDRAGAAFFAAAERREPLGSIIFGSLVRRGLTDVPFDWGVGPTGRLPTLARTPEVLVDNSAADRACRALGTIVAQAQGAASNEEPLLDKAALTWKAWRHKALKMPDDEEFHLTKDYADYVKHQADVVQEPQGMRDMGKMQYEGHTEGSVAQNKAAATTYWERAAAQGDVWSSWYAALTHMTAGRTVEAEPYLDIVGNASAGALTFMAVHFKYRDGIGIAKDPVLAGHYLRLAADFGYSNAQLILAHSYMGYRTGNMQGVEPPGGNSDAAALIYYKAAASGGRLVPKLNVALLTARGADPTVTDPGQRCVVAYKHLGEIIYRGHPSVHLLFAHARRAYDVGDAQGAQLRFALLSDAGSLQASLNAAYLWDTQASAPTIAPGSSVPGRCFVGGSPGLGAESLLSVAESDASRRSCAFYYHRRAASAGHVPSMNELSARLRDGTRLPLGWVQDEPAACRWTTLAASQNDSRALFDLAYMVQTGGGCRRNDSLAEEIYERLWQRGNLADRIASLSGMGLQRLRTYFFEVQKAVRPAVAKLTRLASWVLGPLAGSVGHAGHPATPEAVVREPSLDSADPVDPVPVAAVLRHIVVLDGPGAGTGGGVPKGGASSTPSGTLQRVRGEQAPLGQRGVAHSTRTFGRLVFELVGGNA